MTSTPKHRSASETGLMPRVDVEPETQHEPLPPTLPEFEEDAGGITGKMPAPSEGEDKAKQLDDSSSASV